MLFCVGSRCGDGYGIAWCFSRWPPWRSLPHRQLRNATRDGPVARSSSLPHRQLRNTATHNRARATSSLPHRQLRKPRYSGRCKRPCSLPHRQQRNWGEIPAAVEEVFTHSRADFNSVALIGSHWGKNVPSSDLKMRQTLYRSRLLTMFNSHHCTAVSS